MKQHSSSLAQTARTPSANTLSLFSQCKAPMTAVASTLTLVSLMTKAATAHPGHGTTDPESPAHYLVEPVHAWWAIPLFVGIGVVAALAIRHRQQHQQSVRPEDRSHHRDE